MTISSAVVTAGTAPTLVLTAPGSAGIYRPHVTLRNNSAVSEVFVGGSNVTIANGLLIPVGARVDFPVSPGDKVYAVVAAGTADVAVLTTAG